MEGRTDPLSPDRRKEIPFVLDTTFEDRLKTALTRVDIPKAIATYRAQGEAIWIADLLGPELMGPLLSEMESVRSLVHRNYVPTQKKGGSVSYFQLRERAPQLVALYKHPALIRLLEQITGERLMVCPENDPHACAL